MPGAGAEVGIEGEHAAGYDCLICAARKIVASYAPITAAASDSSMAEEATAGPSAVAGIAKVKAIAKVPKVDRMMDIGCSRDIAERLCRSRSAWLDHAPSARGRAGNAKAGITHEQDVFPGRGVVRLPDQGAALAGAAPIRGSSGVQA
jgi:hypothetical protein